MKQIDVTRHLSLILCVLLIAVSVGVFMGCSDETDTHNGPIYKPGQVHSVGEGSKQFVLTVTDADGVETQFFVKTDCETVGEALLALGLIEGEQGQYGLYTKRVNGVRADYDLDQVYWAFYVNGQYASAGVDSTTIAAGHTYAFKAEK